MSDKSGPSPKPGTPFNRFRDLTGKLLQVPKKEVDKKESAWRRRKKRKGGAT